MNFFLFKKKKGFFFLFGPAFFVEANRGREKEGEIRPGFLVSLFEYSPLYVTPVAY